MKKTVLNTSLKSALSMALIVTLGVSVSACSSHDEEEVYAIDRVEDAAELARKNAPEPEDMEFAETAPMVTAAGDATITAAADMPAATDTAGAAPAETTVAAVPEDLAVNVGAQLYNKQCVACHQNGLLNAPKYGDAAAWAPRIAKGKETLYTHAANGFNQMNAQVNAEVTEEQVHAAVDYMVAAAS
ncbi:c-type cytochrome [Psychrobacter sp. 72-O-c]|uniref:c-type cytochrome n=1 Tax=Psychrobacter sp. 72-O-c TaxID=2774125 RepID=UPI001D115F87|nr:c-type cytochrome [Psychrobacter sp. 72-O-c]